MLGKAVDTDKSAVVTLTFSRELKNVRIDPGYIGRVDVDSRTLPHNAAMNNAAHPIVVGTTQSANPEAALAGFNDAHQPTSAVAAANMTLPAVKAAPVIFAIPMPSAGAAANQSANLPTAQDGDGVVSIHAPLPEQVNDASQMPFTATATPGPSTVTVSGSQLTPKQHSLYWAEPITPPNGKAPQVASNQMKLIEVKGTVSIKTPER